MKNTLYIILCILFYQFAYTQNLNIVYEVTVLPNKNDKTFSEKSILFLTVDKDYSYFYTPLMNNSQKQMEMISNDKGLSDKILKSTLTTYIIKKNIANKSVTHYLKLDETFAYQDKFNLQWELTDRELQILGYNCKSAKVSFRGRNYIAFFTEDIPINDGPYKFYGLPGLILKLTSDDGDYDFTAVGIEKNMVNIDLELKNSIITTREKYLLEMKKLAKNPSENQRLRDQSNGFQYKTIINGKEVTNEEKYKMFDKMIWEFMKNHNNPIEIDDIWIR